VVCDQAIQQLGIAVKDCRVILQGFGNVGSNAAKLLYEKGYRILGIADLDGGLYNANGIDIHALLAHRAQAGTIVGFSGAEAANPAELITRVCEILIPAATENVITSRNAAALHCRILCEGANGPTTIVADEILAANGVFVLPDILANAGGVTASYFEWVQDRMGYFWTEAEVNQRLDRIMTDSFRDVIAYAQSHSVNNRIAAYMLAVDRVAYTAKQRGMYA
jgi:glutamate dehydrogenase (NAD(P)+)